MKKNTAFQVLLALVALAHLALGLTANLAPPETLAKIVSLLYGATIDVTPQTHHLIRIIGAFMIGVGVMAGLACRDPQRNRAVVSGIIVILLLRVLQRLVLPEEIRNSFHLAPAQIWVQAAFFFVTAAALVLLRPKAAPGTAV